MNNAIRCVRRFHFPLVVLVLAAIACTVVSSRAPADMYAIPPEHSVYTCDIEPIALAFGRHVESYRVRLSALSSDLQWQGVFVVVAFMLIVRKSQDMDMPVLGVKVSAAWLHFLVPAALLYLWLKFGFLLNNLIRDRVILWAMLRAQPGSGGLSGYSQETLLRDSGMLDGWFAFFQAPGQHYMRVDDKRLAYFVYTLVYGGFIGCSHACTLVVSHLGATRYASTSATRWLYSAFPYICLAILIASHLLFLYGGENPNGIQIPIAAFASVLCFALLWLAFATDAPEIDALRRKRTCAWSARPLMWSRRVPPQLRTRRK